MLRPYAERRDVNWELRRAVSDLSYGRWLARRGATHAHCPHECEHPQPYIYKGVLVCGVCHLHRGVISKMEPCVPGVCADAQ